MPTSITIGLAADTGAVDDRRPMTGQRNGDPPRHDDPLELELADVPRRLPRGNPRDLDASLPTPGVLPAATPPAPLPPSSPRSSGEMAPLPASTPSADHEHPNPWPAHIVKILLGGLLLYAVYLGYRRVTRPDVVAISSPYRSHTGVTIELPGRGWKADRRQRMKRENAGAWVRADAMFHGESFLGLDQLVVAIRTHAPGGFGDSLDPERMRTQLESQLRNGVAQAGASIRNLSCVVDNAVRPATTVACFGRIGYLDQEMPAGVFIWQASNEDMVGIGYATTADSLEPLLEMARTAR